MNRKHLLFGLTATSLVALPVMAEPTDERISLQYSPVNTTGLVNLEENQPETGIAAKDSTNIINYQSSIGTVSPILYQESKLIGAHESEVNLIHDAMFHITSVSQSSDEKPTQWEVRSQLSLKKAEKSTRSSIPTNRLINVSYSAADLLSLEPIPNQSFGLEAEIAQLLQSPKPDEDMKIAPFNPEEPDEQLSIPEELRPIRRPAPVLRLLLRSAIVTNSNINALNAVDDSAFVNSANLRATPKLGPDTNLIADVGGNFVRFAASDVNASNILNARVGVQQKLGSQMSGELGWVLNQIYPLNVSDITENSVRLALRRQDQLTEEQDLFLDSGYDFWATFSAPDDRRRISNRLGVGLRYEITPQLLGLLNYRITLDNLERQNRLNTRNQVTAATVYYFNKKREAFVLGSVSYLGGQFFNSVTGNTADLNNISIGLSIGYNVPLF